MILGGSQTEGCAGVLRSVTKRKQVNDTFQGEGAEMKMDMEHLSVLGSEKVFKASRDHLEKCTV